MNDHLKIVIKREELYERIWQTPAKQLAKEYQVSDTRLTVICRMLKVPKPASGYWMKVKHGKKVRRPPLPSLGPGERVEFEHIVGESHKRPIENDPALLALLDKVPAIKVPQRLSVADPMAVFIDTFGTGKIADAEIAGLIRKHFPLRPSDIIEHLKLKRPIYKKTAACGDFGRNDPDFTWEKTD